jgi:HAD superfamily hydrolase (TIGR01484 family)
MRSVPLPVRDLPVERCRALSALFTDIDDTLTTDGLLPASTFQALWALTGAKVRIVAVTGRPAGWCDHIARMWPVAGVIGENGALIYSYDRPARRMRRTYLLSEEERREGRRRLERIRERVVREVPGCAIAADQPFRLADLAVDFREDVGPLSPEEVRAICRIMESEGAVYKVSSIHINCWYGDFDKVSGVRRFLADGGQEMEDPRVQAATIFIGDSPNDEPLFRALEATIGVANIRPFLETLRHPPVYITQAEAAAGFAETVGIILAKRSLMPGPRQPR